MYIKVGAMLEIVRPTIEMQIWIQTNLTLSNPEYERRKALGLWVNKDTKYIRNYYVNDNNYSIPYGCLEDIKELTDPLTNFINVHNPKIKVEYRGEIDLRTYQILAVKKLIQKGGGVLIAPPGSGKTQMALGLIQKLGVKTLWIVHTKDLMEQSMDRAKQFFDSDLFGTITDGKIKIGKGITFATIQTLASKDIDLFKDAFTLVVVDECHRVGGSITNISMYSKVLNKLNAHYKYGLTATPTRSDGLINTMYHLLGNVAYKVEQENINDFLVRVDIHKRNVKSDIDLKKCMSNMLLRYSKLVTAIINNKTHNEEIVKDLIENKNEINLVLSERLAHLETLYKMLPLELQQKTAILSGLTEKVKRKEFLEQLRNGEIKYLFASYKLAREGLDVPNLTRLYFATPQKDRATILQAIGRVQRIAEGKDKGIVYDYVDNNSYSINGFKYRQSIYRQNKYNLVLEDD